MCCHGNHSTITLFTQASQWMLHSASSIRSHPHIFFKIYFNIIIPHTPWNHSGLFPFFQTYIYFTCQEDIWGSGSTAPLILNLGTRWVTFWHILIIICEGLYYKLLTNIKLGHTSKLQLALRKWPQDWAGHWGGIKRALSKIVSKDVNWTELAQDISRPG
jgi:hypothetical protein